MRVLVGAVVLLLAMPVAAIDFFSSKKDDSNASSKGSSLEQRVQMLERRINTLSSIVLRLDRLQQDVQELRGDMELQNHNMENLKQRQLDLYNDMDQRVSRLTGESPAGLPASGMSGTTPAPTSQANATTGQPQTSAPQTSEPNWESSPLPSGSGQQVGTVQNQQVAASAGGMQQQSGGSRLPPVVSATSPSTAPGQLQTTTVSMAPRASSSEERDAKSGYDQAFNLLMDSKYDQAKQAFREFLIKHPGSRLAPNAQYWLAQASYITRDYDEALAEFTKMTIAYPHNQKVSDALLKIGYIQYEKKQWSQAKSTLNNVRDRYPNTPASQRAQERLDKMRAQGH